MSYLVVVAHPDDEVLGAGATIHKLVQQGERVNVCIMSAEAEARAFRPSDNVLREDTENSMHLLGVTKIFYGSFPNIKLNIVPHLELVQFIENAIIETGAHTIFTHHPSDLNQDHLYTSLACQAASRLFQRRADVRPLRELLFMEVLSSTDWALNSSVKKFEPNTYVPIGNRYLDKKIEALSLYRDVMRAYPHPRSAEGIRALAAYRGSQAGIKYAEAFESVFRRVE